MNKSNQEIASSQEETEVKVLFLIGFSFYERTLSSVA